MSVEANQESQDVGEQLESRLIVGVAGRGHRGKVPQILPDQNPSYPRKMTQVKNLGGATKMGNQHFSQLATPLKNLEHLRAGPEQSGQKDERVIILKITPPLDAVKLLESSPRGTFFYMQRVDKLLTIRNLAADEQLLLQGREEFDLFVCPHHMVDVDDYYTLSEEGVAHVCKQQHTFTSMKDWLDELQKLQALRDIPVFKNFRIWKPLALLRKAVTSNRQMRAGKCVGDNLFMINQFLRFSLAITIECTNGIRSMNVIVTQEDVDELQRLKHLSRKQQKGEKKAPAVEADRVRKVKQSYGDALKMLQKLFEQFNNGKPISRQGLDFPAQGDENRTDTNFTETVEQTPGAAFYTQGTTYKFPFTIEEHNTMTERRCDEMLSLFEQMMIQLITQVRGMINQVIVADCEKKLPLAAQNATAQQQQPQKTTTSYTERASRLNMCRRLVNYLRLTDFMIMDALYDFQYITLNKYYTRMQEAGKFALPTPAEVVASQEELLHREQMGQYLFDGKQVDVHASEEEGQDGAGLEDAQGKLISLGDGSKGIFLGFVRCATGDRCAAADNCRDTRQQADAATPGQPIYAGDTARIELYPSAQDFYEAMYGYGDQILCKLDAIKRLTNHEDFADISLPVFCNLEATFEKVDDRNKLGMLAEINTPTLQVLFASNPGFKILVENIKQLLFEQYDRSVEWAKSLQPYYDAFNQAMNLDVVGIERKLFQVPVSLWDGGDLAGKDKKWSDGFAQLTRRTTWQETNDYDQFMAQMLAVDFKEIASQCENNLSMPILSKAAVPLCSKSGLNKTTLLEFLFSDQEFSELLSLFEHNRRLIFSMPQVVCLGMFTFDAQELKEAFLPVSQRVLNYVRAAIPAAIVKRIILLLMNIQMMKKFINQTFFDVESFILYREVILLISDEVIEYVKAFVANIVQFITMYEQHGVKLPPQVTNLLVFFNQQFDIFKTQIISAEANLDQLTQGWLQKQEEECQRCEEDLKVLKTQMRLKSLNRNVEIFSAQDFAKFAQEYEANYGDFRKNYDESQLSLEQLNAELYKQQQSGNQTADLEQKISEVKATMVADCFVVPFSSLTAETVLAQHRVYVDLTEQSEEEEEPDELEQEREVVEEEKSEIELSDEGQADDENNTAEPGEKEAQPAEEKPQQEVVMEEKRNPEEEELLGKTYHGRLSTALVKLGFRAKKTEGQKAQLDVIEARIRQLRNYQQQLQAEQHEFPLLDIVSGHIKQYYNLWTSSLQWLERMIVMQRSFFLGDLNQEDLSQVITQTGKTAFMCEKAITTSEMPAILKARVTEMRQMLPIVASLDNAALREQHWKNVGDILQKPIPMVEALASNTQAQQGGEQKEIVEQPPDHKALKPQLNIAWLIQNNALLYKDSLSQVSNNAANELSLERQFVKIEADWAKIMVQSAPYKDSHDIFVLRETADLITKLEDSLLVVSGIACSRYVGSLKEKVESLLDRLKQLNHALDAFLKVQKGYLYLLNIFASQDIQKSLPTESKMFQDLDSFWRRLMAKVYDYPMALGLTYLPHFLIVAVKDEQNIPGLSLKPCQLEIQLRKYEMVLDQIQKSLDNYLQAKRMEFARLFFISDDELLDLLAQAKNPHMLQGHMRKLFENVVQVELVHNVSIGGLEIISLQSEEGERLPLMQSVKPKGSVTLWLKNLELQMKKSVAKAVKSAVDGYSNFSSRNQWIVANLGQTVIAASQVFWCLGLTEAIDGHAELASAGVGRLKGEQSPFQALRDPQAVGRQKDQKQTVSPLQIYYNKFDADLQNLIVLIKSNLSKLQRGAVTALATIETHSRDTIGQLIQHQQKNGLTSTADFAFQKLQRYYYRPMDPEVPIVIMQNTTETPYQNEYLGASGRLVITPLTDLVYLHIAVSVQNCKAINLAGPAGTGKSESTKDQNKSRANACVVFNCSDTVEISVMNRFFMGFCMTGAGSCLDEFNRLELSLLSVIAGSIKQILDGLKIARYAAVKKEFIFNGYQLPLHPETMIAISLNPGYAGRAELPQNLKNLFRSFSMVVPDYSLISEIILFSQGFTTAKPLSRKVVQLYKLSSEQLSQQNSYDFGMRGVKSVLSMAGNLRRKFPDQSEEMVLIRAMQDSNLPRMIADDRDLFMGIIQDLFPNVVYVQTPNTDFVQCIEHSMNEKKYLINPVFTEKINQVFETCQIRHGVLLMGNAKSGKTLCLNTLTEALGLLRQKVETKFSPEQKKAFDMNYPLTAVNATDVHLINSKAITINELYGSYDETSGEWKDGLLGDIMRRALESTKTSEVKTHKQFILFDSHVSTEWIESMNSLLDDSKLLCLANSERLKINDYINIVFECETLKHASPATVSRLGIIFYPEATLADAFRTCSIQMRPKGGYKNMTEEEITAHEQKVLKSAITMSLKASIVRWDHVILRWFRSGMPGVTMFEAMNQASKDASSQASGVLTGETYAQRRLSGLILKLFAIFVPHGLKFYAQNAGSLLPTNEVQLVRQTMDVFKSVLHYNRSLACLQRKCKQEELNKFAQENGLQEASQAQDVTDIDPFDIGLLVRYLCLQYLKGQPQVLANPPASSILHEMFVTHIQNSNELICIEQLIKQAFLFGFIWSFGGILAAGAKASREEFDNLVRGLIEQCNDQYTAMKGQMDAGDAPKEERVPPFDSYEGEIPSALQMPLIPNQGSVFDYYLDWKAVIDFQNQLVENFTFLPPSALISARVPRYAAIKNTSGFTISTSAQIVGNISNVTSVFANLTEEQAGIINVEILKPGLVTLNTFGDLLTPYQYKPRVPFFNIFIETADTLRYQHLLETLLKSQVPVLLTGQAGSGKTSVVMNMLQSLDRRQLTQNIQINFSARTSSLRIQQIMEESLFQKGKTYLPQPGKTGILYIDDMNLPAKDQYECSQPIEFLRFFMDTKGFYDRKDLFWKTVESTTLLGSCAPPGGGRETLTTRLTSSFAMVAQPESEDDSLCKIYNTILQGFFEHPEYKYGQEVIQSSQGIVKALIQIYHGLSSILKPTPSKLHYSFNLRDVSKVIQGLMRSSAKVLKTSDELISLFIHEVMRVFADRTTSAFDNEQVCKCVTEVLNTCPGTGLKKSMQFEALFDEDGNAKTFEEGPPANPAFDEHWGNYMKFGCPPEERIYEIKDQRFVQSIMYQYLEQYNTESGKQKMGLVLFEDAVGYVNKIARILSSERGNLLNVGVGGSGRKSLTKLAAHMCEYRVESIQLKKGYGQSDFHNDVKELYIRCGLKGENIVFLLDESQLVSGAILEDINNILNSGVISNLFDAKDMEKIITDTRQQINESGLSDMVDTNNKASVFSYFISKVRDKLHVVLCLSPSGDEFRARLRTYPSLLTCMSIVWFHPWPRSALQDVSRRILTDDLQKVNFEALVGADAAEQAKFAKQLAVKLAPVATEIHSNTERLLGVYASETNRRHYLPPATFLDLLNIYSLALNGRIQEISTRLTQFKTGVQRLIDAKAQVETLQKQQEELKPVLEQKSQDTNALIEQINIESVQVNELRKKALEDAALVAAQTKDCQLIAADADRDLKACEPLIQEATRAVENIDSGMIAEMRTVKNPAPLVFLTMQSVAILLGYKPDWAGCVQMFSNAHFLASLKEYDRDKIPDSTLKALKKYTESKQYDLPAIEKVSVACKSLAVWVLALEKYAHVYREVEPKRKRLQQANDELSQKQEALKVKQENLAKVEKAFQELQDKFNKSNAEKQELEAAMQLTVARLDRAEKLTGALGDERVRWIKQSEELQELMTMVVGDVFLASCGIGYFGVFNREYRVKLITYWHGLLEIYGIKTSSIQTIIQKGLFGLISSEEITLERWKDCGLPSDMQSIDNALIMDQIMKSKWPLLIDPQNQAANFIKKLEKKIKVIRPTQFGIVHIFEQAVHDGDVILLDGVGEKLDPTLQPIIEKQFITLPNGQQQVNLGGDQPIDVHKDFKLYITTKLQNPRYSPETHAKLQIINFSISVDALENQILSEVIQLEYPRLEETRVELAKDASANKKQLLELADQILFNLSSFQGSVLDNEPLIKVLNESKRVSQIIKEKEIESASTREEIARYYGFYAPVGVRAALIYFLISDMSMVEQMYLFALGYYKQLVQQEIKRINDFKEDGEHIPERVKAIIEKMTFNLFTSISRGLFEKDKTVFGMLLGCRIYQRAGLIAQEEWNLFVKGKVYADMFLSDPLNTEHATQAQKALLDQVNGSEFSDKLRSQLATMGYVPYLNNLCKAILESFVRIQTYMVENKRESVAMISYIISLDENHASKFPILREALTKYPLSLFQRLILTRLLAEEYFYVAVPQFVEALLDNRYAAIQPQSIKQLYDDSTPYSPMLFIISEGVDPVAQTCQLADELHRQVSIISLGKGQTPLVKQELAKATVEGQWVFLQNVHLASADFLPELELIVETLGLSTQAGAQSQLDYISLPLHPNFRLLLSSTPVSTFPQSVLQAALKCTTEPPLSMKKNVLRQLAMMDSSKFEFEHMASEVPAGISVDGVRVTWKRIIYGLMFFHSQVLERKKFGPQGYNLNYDFNDTDLEICVLSLEDFLRKSFKTETRAPTDQFVTLDWDALDFIYGEIHYCGKVNDSWDKRCVKTMLRYIINQKMTMCGNPQDPRSALPFSFVEGDSRYALSFINANTSLQDIQVEVQKMPNIDATDVFGMSKNSDIVNQQAEAARIIDRILGVSADCLEALAEEATPGKPAPKEGEKKPDAQDRKEKMSKEQQQQALKQRIQDLNIKVFGVEVKVKTMDEIVKGITEQLLKRLPPLLNINDACQASVGYDENGIPLCMTTILRQDMERFNQLLSYIQKSLVNITLAIKGDVILSQDLEDQYKALYVGKVPGAWSKIAYPSLKPLASWFEDLLLRVEFMKGWLTQGPPGSFWISGLYFPQGFVTALLQTHARRCKISVDKLRFDFAFASQEWSDWTGTDLQKQPGEPAGSTAVWIHGLYVDCGFYDIQKQKLESSREGLLYPKFPYIKMIPVDSTVEKEQEGYRCPVYKTSQRAGVLSSTGHSTNFILPIIIPTDFPEGFFVRLGTSALCQLDQ